ncbi:MAG: hypothetical protein EHM47_17045 [Ignavibacteriales bacterium]|nr:MAG: hypothetical protein EHM47_17045 [Ignavibacteriales bacterium]
MKISAIIITIFFTTHFATYSQDFIEIGISAGPAFMSSDSPYISGFTTSVSAGAGKLYNTLSPRVTFYYAGDINSLLPASDRSYYPFIKAFAAKGIYAVNISSNFYYEQGLGLFIANDRIFRSTNSWAPGFIVSALGGADLRGESYSGFRIGIGGEYGLTVYNRYIRYIGIFFQAQYIIALK